MEVYIHTYGLQKKTASAVAEWKRQTTTKGTDGANYLLEPPKNKKKQVMPPLRE